MISNISIELSKKCGRYPSKPISLSLRLDNKKCSSVSSYSLSSFIANVLLAFSVSLLKLQPQLRPRVV